MRKHLATIIGALLLAPEVWKWLKWAMDWAGRIDFLSQNWRSMMAMLSDIPPWLSFTLFLFGGGLIWWDLKGRPKPNWWPSSITDLTEAPAKKPSIGRLTEDQRAFRIALKQFALTHPERLLGLLARVRSALVQRIKDAGDKDYSWALHQAMHSGWSNSGQSLLRIKELAGIESELIDIDGLANALRVFFGDYEWDQKGIANLNMITKIDDLRTLSETQKWLSADKDCLLELIKLKVWPDGSSLKKISEDQMATPGINWTRPYRVNF